MKNNINKVLIIRFSSIGDIVLTSPVVRCLKNKYPNIQIHYLTKKNFVEVIENNPYIDKIYAFEKNFWQILKQLKQEKYDYIIDLHNNQRTFLFKMLLCRKSKSFSKLNIKKWLAVNFKYNILPKIHIVERYLKTVHFLGIEYDGMGLDYFIADTDFIDIQQKYNIENNQFIAIVVGAKHGTKTYPGDLIIELCKLINEKVILLGGKDVINTANEIQKSNESKIINLCGKLSLNQSASIIKQAKIVITPDTGLMHIASAYKKPIISLWGNTIPDFGMYPCLPKNEDNKSIILEVKGLTCRPCSKIGYKKCPKGHYNCMRQIAPTQIAAAINHLDMDCNQFHIQ